MDIGTWNPKVGEILAHATHEERRTFTTLSMCGGALLGLTLGITFGSMIWMSAYSQLEPFTMGQWIVVGAGTIAAFVVVFVVVATIRLKVRNLLVTFEWAKEQGITPESLKLDRWR